MARLKGRDELQPIALLAATSRGCSPRCRSFAKPSCARVLPGPFTLVLA